MSEPDISPELRAYLEQSIPHWKRYARAIIPLPQRSILAVMTFLGVTFAYGMRICITITIIAIVEPKHKSLRNDSHECPFPEDYSTGDIHSDPIYKWDDKLIGHILSSFYIGYVLTHIPGGILSDLLGGKHVLTGCVSLTSLFTLITPRVIIDGGPHLLVLVQILLGLVQGTMFPAVNVLLASWIPRDERAFYAALVYGSSQIGTILGTAVPGFLLHQYHSWRRVYYLFGAMGLIWCIFFCLMCASEPQNHSYISREEKDMLLKKIGIIHRTSRIRDAPWSEMLVNVPLLALVSAQCGHDFGFFVMVNDLPKYLSDVLHYNITTNGYLVSLPFLAIFIVSIVTGFLADLIIDHNLMSMTNCRKLFSTLAAFLPAIGLILASYAGCTRKLVVLAFTIGMGTMGFFYSGIRVNGLDLSPRFAGTIMAFVNGVGSIMGIAAPMMVGLVTKEPTVEDYRVVFWVAFTLLNGTGLVYLFFGSGDVQEFNHHGQHAKPLPITPKL